MHKITKRNQSLCLIPLIREYWFENFDRRLFIQHYTLKCIYEGCSKILKTSFCIWENDKPLKFYTKNKLEYHLLMLKFSRQKNQ